MSLLRDNIRDENQAVSVTETVAPKITCKIIAIQLNQILQQFKFAATRTSRRSVRYKKSYLMPLLAATKSYFTVYVLFSKPTPVIVKLFQFDGSLTFNWVTPAAVISRPPKPFSMACNMPPAPVEK